MARSTLGGHCSRDCCPRSRGLRASAMTPPKSWPPWSRPLTPRLRTWRPANVHQVSHRKGTPSNDEISDAAIVEPSACEAIQTEATKIEPSDAGDLPSTGSRRRDLRRPDHGDAFDVEGLGGDGRRRGRQRRGPWRPTSHGAETAFHGRTAAAADRQQSTQWPGEDLASGVAVRRRQLIPSEAPHLATEASRVAGVKCARRSCAHRARRHLNCTRRLPKLRTPCHTLHTCSTGRVQYGVHNSRIFTTSETTAQPSLPLHGEPACLPPSSVGRGRLPPRQF